MSAGVATWNGVKGYLAETGRTVTATQGSITGQSSTFTVGPAALDHFEIANIPTQIAGVQFSVQATAFDAFENVKTDYTNSQNAVLSTDAGNSAKGCGGSGNSPCLPALGAFGSWASGVASANVTLFKRETGRHLTATDSGKTGTTNPFDVSPNEPASEAFTVQPTLTQVAPVAIAPAVVVTVSDYYGNPVSAGKQVTMSIGANPGSSTLTGGGPVSTLSNGTATFGSLTLNNPGVNYTLVASVPSTDPHVTSPVTATSGKFDIGNQVTHGCSGNCTATGSDSTNTTTSTITVSGGAAGDVLGAVVTKTLKAPANVCASSGFGQAIGIAGTAADFITTTSHPTFTIVTRIDKSIVQKAPGPNGATKFEICLGALNTLHPVAGPPPITTCTDPNTSNSFPKKDGGGGCAVFNNSTGFNYFWGVLPDAPNGAKSCTDSKIKFPVVLSKTKNGAGDVVLTSCVPSPFDPHPFGGP